MTRNFAGQPEGRPLISWHEPEGSPPTKLYVLLLLLTAFGYYGSYLFYGINFRDEGQTVALIAQRLLQGERPFLDVELGYNVLWFYPVVGLYKLFGVSYVILRGWCFALSTITALLGFFLVNRTWRRPWIAFAVALVLILIPGSQFKNYIPLLAVANTLCLLQFVFTRPGSGASFGLILLGGLLLGITLLIRIDIGAFFAALWLGTIVLRADFRLRGFGRKFGMIIGSIVLLTLLAAAVHVPVYLHARAQGFDRHFLNQYREWGEKLAAPFASLLARTPAAAQKPAKVAGELRGAPKERAEPAIDRTILQRPDWRVWWDDRSFKRRALLFLSYAPLLTIAVLVCWAAIQWLIGLRSRDPDGAQRGLAGLVLMGGALTVFPQFFLFRPDLPHLSEFMPCFLAASFACMALLRLHEPPWRWTRFPGLLLLVFLIAHTAVYVIRVLPDRWAGTAAIRSKRNTWFAAENGVRVYVTSREFNGLTAIQRLIRNFSRPDEYVVCYPYSPGINLLTNRRTYERNVYVDNATRTRNWDAEAIARIEKHRPAVIVISDWKINDTPASEFKVWAARTKEHIEANYTSQGKYLEFEVFTREKEPVTP